MRVTLQHALPPSHIPQPNPIYLVAAAAPSVKLVNETRRR